MPKKRMTIEERWENGVPHGALAEKFCELAHKLYPEVDYSFGGDGDDGETIMYVVDILEGREAATARKLELVNSDRKKPGPARYGIM